MNTREREDGWGERERGGGGVQTDRHIHTDRQTERQRERK